MIYYIRWIFVMYVKSLFQQDVIYWDIKEALRNVMVSLSMLFTNVMSVIIRQVTWLILRSIWKLSNVIWTAVSSVKIP